MYVLSTNIILFESIHLEFEYKKQEQAKWTIDIQET